MLIVLVMDGHGIESARGFGLLQVLTSLLRILSPQGVYNMPYIVMPIINKYESLKNVKQTETVFRKVHDFISEKLKACEPVAGLTEE